MKALVSKMGFKIRIEENQDDILPLGSYQVKVAPNLSICLEVHPDVHREKKLGKDYRAQEHIVQHNSITSIEHDQCESILPSHKVTMQNFNDTQADLKNI